MKAIAIGLDLFPLNTVVHVSSAMSEALSRCGKEASAKKHPPKLWTCLERLEHELRVYMMFT